MRTPTDPEPDGRAVLGLSLDVVVLSAVAFCVALGFGIVAPALPIFARSFGVSATAASAVISVFALVRLVGATPAGALVDRVGERTTLAWGLAVVAVSSALAGLATTYLQLLVLRGVGGLGSAMFTVSAMSLLLRSVERSERVYAAMLARGYDGEVRGTSYEPLHAGGWATLICALAFYAGLVFFAWLLAG